MENSPSQITTWQVARLSKRLSVRSPDIENVRRHFADLLCDGFCNELPLLQHIAEEERQLALAILNASAVHQAESSGTYVGSVPQNLFSVIRQKKTNGAPGQEAKRGEIGDMDNAEQHTARMIENA